MDSWLTPVSAFPDHPPIVAFRPSHLLNAFCYFVRDWQHLCLLAAVEFLLQPLQCGSTRVINNKIAHFAVVVTGIILRRWPLRRRVSGRRSRRVWSPIFPHIDSWYQREYAALGMKELLGYLDDVPCLLKSQIDWRWQSPATAISTPLLELEECKHCPVRPVWWPLNIVMG